MSGSQFFLLRARAALPVRSTAGIPRRLHRPDKLAGCPASAGWRFSLTGL
jgi:hypothetical protein